MGLGQAHETLLSFQMFNFLETQLLGDGPVKDTPDFIIEPVTTGWAAQMVPLCYAPPFSYDKTYYDTLFL